MEKEEGKKDKKRERGQTMLEWDGMEWNGTGLSSP